MNSDLSYCENWNTESLNGSIISKPFYLQNLFCGQHPAFIKIEPSVIQRLHQANTSRGFIIHSIAVVIKRAERYDRVKIKTKKRKKNIVISHNSVA